MKRQVYRHVDENGSSLVDFFCSIFFIMYVLSFSLSPRLLAVVGTSFSAEISVRSSAIQVWNGNLYRDIMSG